MRATEQNANSHELRFEGVLKGGKFVYPLLVPHLLEVDKVSYSIS
jgi:hypothetical protein